MSTDFSVNTLSKCKNAKTSPVNVFFFFFFGKSDRFYNTFNTDDTDSSQY